MLSLLPMLLGLSPSTTLSDPVTASNISKRLETPARLHTLHAISVNDPRLMDIMIGTLGRTYSCFMNVRLLEGWTEQTSNVGLVWITGLGKLGGIGELLYGRGNDQKPGDERSIQIDRRLAEMKNRTQVFPPPRNAQEAGNRINLL